jgi:hypothetical protein
VRTIETKGEYARRKNRKPSAVSNWIADGKISREALVGEGNAARIWVERADEDLIASLNPAQQHASQHPANARTTFLPLTTTLAPAHEALAAKMPAAPGAMSDRELDLARRAKADADRAEYEAEASRRRLLVDDGKYVVAEDAARAWVREMSKLISQIETFLSTTLARQLAEKHGLDWKALTVEMREEFRVFRASVSDDARTRGEAIEAEADAAEQS